MLLGPNKKSLSTIILSKVKPGMFSDSGYDVSKEEAGVSDDSLALDAAAEKVFSAVDAKDKKELISALRSIFLMFESEEDTLEEG